ALIRELERQFKITEEVMKFLSVKLDEEVDLDAFKVGAEEKKVKVEPVLEEAQAPEPQVPAQPADSEEQSEVVAQVVVPQTGVEAPTGPEASAAADSGGSDDTRSAEQAKEGS
ncbi:MAG: hypothetical protein FJY85_15045, partial [Deltaproteobacteria bacterium]|nr:hypothetical protein [Deltaproteobacteria bacterium]